MAKADNTYQDDLNIGAKVRKMRNSKGVSLQQLAKETGMSYSFLSALENDKHSISVTNLQRLARYFDVDLIYFLENRSFSPVFIDKEEFGSDPDEMLYNVVTSRHNRNLQISYVTLPSHSPSEHHPHRHAEGSEEYILVLSGQAIVEVEEQRYELSAMDGVCFSSKHLHLVYTENQPAQLIIVSSPPYGREDTALT